MDQHVLGLAETPISTSQIEIHQTAATEMHAFGLSAQSLVLANQDLLDLIFSFTDPDAFSPDGIWDIDPSTRRTLFSVCLTCTSFFHPASNLLWRMMTSFLPIFKILPTFTKANEAYTMSGTIKPDHMKRLQMYTSKIRFLYIKSFQDSIAGHLLFRFTHLKDFTLFPVLRVLYVPTLALDFYRNLENFNVLFLAQGDSLTTVTLGGINSSNEGFTSSFLSILSQKATSLQELILGGRLTLETLAFVCKFNQLQILNLTFDASVAQSEIIRYCSDLKALTHLIIHLTASSTFDSLDLNAKKQRIQGFDNLQVLRLSGLPTEISKILESIDQAQSLRNIVLTSSLSWPQNLLAVSASVKSCINECRRISPSLNQLSVRMGKSKAVILTDNPLSSFMDYKKLHVLELTGVSMAITDDNIRDLCENDHWHSLRVLILPSSIEGSSPSFSSLHVLARKCPNLRTLTIPIDLRLHDHKSLQSERSVPRHLHHLERLTIIKTNIQFESNNFMLGIAVSRFLEYQFPSLKEAKLISDTQGDATWWKGVTAMMAEFHSIRAEATTTD